MTFDKHKNRWGEHGYFQEGECSDFQESIYFLYYEVSKAHKKNEEVNIKFEKYSKTSHLTTRPSIATKPQL